MLLKKFANFSFACIVALSTIPDAYAKEFINFSAENIEKKSKDICSEDFNIALKEYEEICEKLVNSLYPLCCHLATSSEMIAEEDKAFINTFLGIVKKAINESKKRLKSSLAEDNKIFRESTERAYYMLYAVKELYEYKLDPELFECINGISSDIIYGGKFDFVEFGKELIIAERELKN